MDIVGLRLPRSGRASFATWFFSHLPQSGAIAAIGAAMVGLVQHAHDDRTPAEVPWLLGGAVALALGFIAIESTVVESSGTARSPLVVGTYAAGTVAVLALAAARPAPWLLATLVVLVLGITWLVCFVPSVGREFDDSAPFA